jgi:hypothetical protein
MFPKWQRPIFPPLPPRGEGGGFLVHIYIPDKEAKTSLHKFLANFWNNIFSENVYLICFHFLNRVYL